MKIFVMGSEGAGKTVFVTMLSRYISQSDCGLTFEPADYETSRYIVGVQQVLGNGEWPPSTLVGQSFVLRWNFSRRGKAGHEFAIYDAAGQDLRMLLLGVTGNDAHAAVASSLPAGGGENTHLASLYDQISQSDVLMYLLDMEALIGSQDAQEQNENYWLLKTFLSHPAWKTKERVVLLSKKDQYEALLQSNGNDVKTCIKEHLPRFYSTSHWFDDVGAVQYLAFSSVAVETTINQQGTPMRRPSKPFRPGDMSALVQYLTGVTDRSEATEELIRRGDREVGGLAWIVLFIIGAFLVGLAFRGLLLCCLFRQSTEAWPAVATLLTGLDFMYQAI
jgi:GTPase SAR1 family protein